MSDKREMSAQQLIRDIGGGMTASELMKTYDLSHSQLQSAFQQLERIVPDPTKLYGRTSPSEAENDPAAKRRDLRHDVALPLSVYDIKRPENRGLLLDITRNGMRLHGIACKTMEIATYAIRSDEIFDAGPIVLDAHCRWTKRQHRYGTSIGGFEITDISPRNLKDLQRLVQLVMLINKDMPSNGLQPRLKSQAGEITTAVWKCPACNMPQTREFEECPQCHVIVSKYLARLNSMASDLRGSRQKARLVKKEILVPSEIWTQTEAQGSDPDDTVTRALDFYFKSRELNNYRARYAEPTANGV